MQNNSVFTGPHFQKTDFQTTTEGSNAIIATNTGGGSTDFGKGDNVRNY